MSLLLRPLCRLSQTTLKTVNGDFHKVKEGVFVRKTPVSKQAKAAPAIARGRQARRDWGLLAEVGAQGGQLGAQLGDLALEAGEAVLGGGESFRACGR